MGIKQFNIAIIGAGYMAEEHIKSFQSFPQAKITCIYSRTLTKSQLIASKYNIPNVYASLEEICEHSSADLVVVAVTETSLVSLMDILLAKVWTILLEKPIGLSFSECLEIHNKVTRSKKNNIFVALNRRFYSSTQHVLNDLKFSKGKRFIHVIDHQSLSIAKSLHYSPEILEAWMYKNSIHTIDYFNSMGRGRIQSVNVIQKWDITKLRPVLAHLIYENNDEGFYQGVWHGPGPWAVSVTTENHYFEMKPLEEARVRTTKGYLFSSYPISEDDKLFKPGLKKQAEHILHHLQKEPNMSVSFADAFKTMKIVYDLYER